MNLLRRFAIFLVAVVVGFVAPVSTYALTAAQMDFYAQNNILFYDPNGGEEGKCEIATSNGVYKGMQYSLTEDEIIGISRIAIHENACNINAFRTELSQMVNLYESIKTSRSLVDYLRNGGWYHAASWYDKDDPGKPITDEHIQVAKDVLLNGNRNLPPQVSKHDCIGDIVWVELDGKKYYSSGAGNCNGTGLYDKSLYVSGKTKIHTVYHSGENEHFVFYRFAGGWEPDACGDVFGYAPGNTPTESYSTVTSSNVNYAGTQVWSDAEMQAIEANRAIYEGAASKYNIPWQILAVIHSHETGLQRYNPDNGQGVYQLAGYTDYGTNANRFEPADSISEEEFRRQTEIAAEIVSNMAGDLSQPNNVKKLFFRYNGMAQEYIDKAIQMGFSEVQAGNGEGSPYVMNRYDGRRDPTSANMSPYWRGRFVGDGVYDPEATTTGFGAFVQYEALVGGSSALCTDSSNGKIADTAIELAWSVEEWATKGYPGGSSCLQKNGVLFPHPWCEPKPAYEEAMKEVGTFERGVQFSPGASCDRFVATVVRYSGADPNFPKGSTSSQYDYMVSHPDMYMEVEVDSVDDLQPGDIFDSRGEHIVMYVGLVNGKETVAEASIRMYTGRLSSDSSYISNIRNNGKVVDYWGRSYTVFRRINWENN